MIRKKPLLLMFASLFTASALLAGCGSNTNGETTSSVIPENSSGSQAATGETVTLKVMSASQTEKPGGDIEKSIAEDFMKEHPNIKIEFMAVASSDMWPKITAMATSGDLPDIFVDTPDFYLTADSMGIAADLNEIMGKEFFDRFYPAAIKESNVDGKQLFMPWEAIPMGLVYRTDWFEEAGLNPPETWDDFVKAAQTLTKDTDGDGKTDQWGFANVGTKGFGGGARFLQVLRSFGAEEIREENGEWVTDLDTSEAIAAFQFYTDLDKKYGVVAPGALQIGYTEAVNLMASGKTAMMITGPHTIGMVVAQNPELVGKLSGVAVPKNVQHVSSLGVLGYSIANSSEHKDEAAEYLKFLVSKENQVKWALGTSRLPMLKEAGEDPQVTNNPAISGFMDIVANYVYQKPKFGGYSSIHGIVSEAFQSILTGQATAEEAAKSAANQVREEIAKAQ